MLLAVVAAALFGPLVVADPNDQELSAVLQGPSLAHPLGTDQVGRDVLARLVHAAALDLRVGALGVLFPLVVGTTLGAIAGYFGGLLDTLIGRAVDMVVAFPVLVLVIALVYSLGPGLTSIYIAITIVDWVVYARVVRSQVLVVKRQEFVEAARALGYGHRRTLLRHVAPSVGGQVVAFAISHFVLVILAVATLGYLGLGVAPPTAEWGTMVQEGQEYLTTQWWLVALPGAAIAFTGVGAALLGEGLNDLLRR
jgi:peptide/nickel transport system permease protein